MSKKIFALALCLLVSIGIASAQTVKVSGTVKEASSGAPIPGATVMVDGTLTGTSTDIDGKYTISVSSKGKITVSVIGFVTTTAEVKGRTTIDFALEEDRDVLDDAVVVGYGSAKKVSSIVGSVTTVKADVVKNSPSSSALDALQGQVAGLSVLTTSGVAGDNAVSMTLHGVGSLGSSSTPLYVIDGIPSSSRSIMAMNPNDIESISVLKDASATSIYGSRAANGVVYVSTKSGSYNEKASVTVRSQYGISTLADLTLYKSMMDSDELVDFWLRTGIHTPEYIQQNYYDKGYTANTKWYEELMNLNTPQTQNDITIEGGGRKVSYMFSGSQYHQEGFTPGNYYDRYTVRSNVQAHPMDWLKFGTNLSFSLDNTQQNPYWGSAANGVSRYLNGGLSFLKNPLYPATTVDGKGEWYDAMNTATPEYYMKYNTDEYDRYGVNGNVFVQIEPFRNFKIVSRAGLDGYIKLNNWQTSPTYTDAHGGTPYAGKSTALEYSATITNTAEYSFTVADDHHVSVLAGQEGVENYYNYYYAQSSKQTDFRQMQLQQGVQSTYAMKEVDSESRFLSYFGHLDYDFAHKYYFDATVRRDGVSRFGANKRWANFWSAGAKWNIKKEEFLKNVSAIDALDFKVSYGTQGNAAIGDYPSLGLISSSGSYNEVAQRYVSQPANADLSWEQQALFTVALSGRVFNRVDFDVQYYRRKTSNMLMDVPQPYTTGFTEVTQNVGSMQNTGVDITLGVDILRGRDYFLRFNTTFNYNNQKITELFDGRERWVIANTMVAYVVDSPIMFYMPIYAGVDKETGAPTWYKAGDDPDVTTKDEVTTTFEEDGLTQNTGKKRYAPINGGFSFSGAWKNLSFQADFSYVLGKYLISNDGYFYANPVAFSGYNTHKSVSDYWTPENTDAQWPDWSQGYTMEFDTHLLEDASFLRLKNLQVGYSLPKRWLGWTDNVLKGVKVTFTGRNLLTFTKYTGIDPEVNSNLTYGIAGNSKQYLGGLEITF
jgi:TonB-dependent starch-binding outer membrane protein SusC